MGLTSSRRVLRPFLGLCFAVFLYFVAAMAGALIPAGPSEREAAPKDISVRLLAGPIHYDFLLPLTPMTRASFAPLHHLSVPIDHPEAAWLVIGWGSEAFYTTVGSYRDLTPAAVWHAVTGDWSVLRVDVYGARDLSQVSQEIRMSEQEYRRFLQAVTASFRTDAAGDPVLVRGPRPESPGWFLAATERFHLFRTCNTWISKMLRAAGLRFGVWTPVPFSIRLSHAVYQSSP